ncbi:MAG: SGNH/GDSL hydrolase family protein [Lachnospiraceae bacterium]|nr:SGNH/GDSL hydrolase family protein [Lachnospiraceae bacterium]
MKKGLKKSKIVYSILAILGFVVLLAVGEAKEARDKEKQLIAIGNQKIPEFEKYLQGIQDYDMVILGDSVFGERRDATSIPAQIGERLGITVFNGGFGGTCMGRLSEESSLSYTKDCLSMVSLAKSIAARDFGTQQATRIREGATEHFPVTIDELEQIDFSKVEVLLIGHGLNDYHGEEPVFTENDLYNEYTFEGALRSAVRTLKEAYPDMRIVLVTPPYTWYTIPELTCEEYVLNGYVLEDFVEAELAVARELDIEIIDIYHNGYHHESFEDWEQYTNDGLHPNDEGCALLAQIITDYFIEHPTKP